MYDTICCPEIMGELMPDYQHFFLKKNLVSMRDLHDLRFENLIGTVKSYILMVFDHFQDCEVCHGRAKLCGICRYEKVFLWDIKGTSICKKCRSIYHEHCFREKGCPTCAAGNPVVDGGRQLG